MFHVNVNVNLTEQDTSQINGGIKTNVDMSVKHIIYVKQITFAILQHVIVKMGNIQQVSWMMQ